MLLLRWEALQMRNTRRRLISEMLRKDCWRMSASCCDVQSLFHLHLWVLNLNRSFIYQNEWMNTWHQTKESNLLYCDRYVSNLLLRGGAMFSEWTACFSTWHNNILYLWVGTFTQNLHLFSFSASHHISCSSACSQQWHHAVLWMGSHNIA
jgi:hypothetical protein